jgi:Fur family ferric uptake transcriptional regulator
MSKSCTAAPARAMPRISLSTVYRTLNLFEESGLVTKHDFKDGRARFEPIPDEHHDHLIDIRSGKVIEFRNEEIEAIQELIAKRLGYKLVDHRLELYAVPLKETGRNDLPRCSSSSSTCRG